MNEIASPLTCPENYSCMTTVRLELQFGCCNNIECISAWGICRNYGQKDCMGNNLDDGLCSSIVGPILQWYVLDALLDASSPLTNISSSQEAPYCFRYARTSALGATDTYYSYACGTASADVLVLATATNGAAQTDASDPTGAGDNPLLTIPGVNLPTDTGTGTYSTSNNPTIGNASRSPLSTTAIALIAVAGVVIISIALFLGYWFCLRERKRKHEIVYPPAPPQLDYQQTVSGGAGPGSIYSWSSSVPSGANPNVASSVVGSDLSGGTATETRRLMATVHEQPYEYTQQRHY
jgi:hypothetical protein